MMTRDGCYESGGVRKSLMTVQHVNRLEEHTEADEIISIVLETSLL